MKPSEILDSAANILLRDGWWQGSFYKNAENPDDDPEANKSAPCCQDGAIRRALFGLAYQPYRFIAEEEPLFLAQRRADYFMTQSVKALDPLHEPNPILWNDTPGRTREEVVEAFRGAAELAREAGE